MMAEILGPASASATGSDLYFDRFDGTAATCEDFVACMEEASGVDLRQFRLWYSQAGTPRVSAAVEHRPGTARATLRLAQSVPPTPGQPAKQPMVLPLKFKLFGAETGRELTPERSCCSTTRSARSWSTACPSDPCCRSTAASPRP